jgi:hypothetical protein
VADDFSLTLTQREARCYALEVVKLDGGFLAKAGERVVARRSESFAPSRERCRATMQARDKLPVLGLPRKTNIIPAWRNGKTLQTTTKLVALLVNS